MSNQPSDPSQEPSSASPTSSNPESSDSPAAESNTPVETPATEEQAVQVAEQPEATAATPAPETVAAAPDAATDSPASSDAASKRSIAIGSQRDAADKSLAPSLPKAVREAAANPIAIPPSQFDESDTPADAAPERATPIARAPSKEPVPVPSKREISDDLEQELEATLGSVSMDDVMQKADGAVSSDEIEIEGRYKGTVSRIHKDDVFFTLKGRHEGVASARQFKKPPEVGTMTDIIVKGFNSEDGLYEVAIPGAAVSVEDWSDIEVGSVVEARVTGSNTGGLECTVNSIRGFIPASQIAIHRVENLGDYVNKKLMCMVTEAKPNRKNLVLSHRRVLEKELEEVRKELLTKLEPGATVEGKVTRILDFGAFVDIGGIEGLVHISKLSWERIDKPGDVLSEGENIKVKIEKINPENGKISLSYRDTITHPWEGIEDRFQTDTTHKGTVTRLAQFGAFVRLEPGVEGLVHISELAHHRVVAVKNVVNEGDEVEVKILSVDRPNQKIGLSMKATQPVPEKQTKPSQEEAIDDTPREPAVKPRRKNLRGGMDRRGDGDAFGLKW